MARMKGACDGRDFWSRPGSCVRRGRLQIAGRDAEALARAHGTPLYVFDLPKIGEQVRALHAALDGAGLRHRVLLAVKAQREPEVLAYVRSLGAPGRPAASASTCAPPASCCTASLTAGTPTRSATRAPTSPSATST